MRAAATRCGVRVIERRTAEESSADFFDRLARSGIDRVRVVGHVDEGFVAGATAAGIDVASAPVVGGGRVEMLHYLREQAISETLHRFGNLVRH